MPNYTSLNEMFEINIYIDASDEHARARGNRQFLVGIIISFLLAFCLDSERMKEFSGFLFAGKVFSTDICWIVYIISLSLTLLFRPNYIGYRKVIKLRKTALIISFLWVFVSLVI